MCRTTLNVTGDLVIATIVSNDAPAPASRAIDPPLAPAA